tara:strand:- start:98 stop:397 length:300 start_codon:yes stop_codon:yes gene_type:complete
MEATKEKHATFTPGPWGYSEGEIYRGNNPIASVIPTYGDGETAEDEANARLIAQSPAMYKILREVLIDYKSDAKIEGRDLPLTGKIIREVLANVDGGEG